MSSGSTIEPQVAPLREREALTDVEHGGAL